MSNERTILCGNVSDSNLPFGKAKPLRLRLWGPNQNITLCIDDIRKAMLKDVPPRFLDLVEIATYIYCADQAVSRGGDGVDNVGENWRRSFFLRIPVRQPDFWNASDQLNLLVSTLSFLTEDEYFFEFTKLRDEPAIQQYLRFSEDDSFFAPCEEVILFSGGLDSLAGAVQEAISDKRKVVLVTHKPTRKLARRHRHLVKLLKEHAKDAKPIYIPVSINKSKILSKEYTQRSRSFLYAALSSTIAQMFNLSRIRFYENGIVSMNLPLSAQVVGAKATRTTHPQVINGFAQVISSVAGKRFEVENPFLWKTKTDVLKIIADAGCSELIKFSTSCVHTWEMTKLKTHCGVCSQCIDRRFAVLAAGVENADPEEAYKIDLFTGERDEGEPKTMLSAYVETVSQVAKMKPVEFFGRYGEASRILKHLNESADSTALKLFELHQRHAKQVSEVVDNAIAKNASAIRQRKLPESCLLRLVCDASLSTKGDIKPASKTKLVAFTLGDNVFCRKGQVWIVRYAGGEEFILLPSKGAAYLQILLSNPGTSFSVINLVYQVAKQPNKYILGNAGDSIDHDALAAYRARYKELKEQLEEAQKLKDQGMASIIDEGGIREEMDSLLEEINRNKGLGNRLRKASDDRDRVRKSFRAAIRRVVDEITKYDKRLANHLKPPFLRCGWHPCYDPQEDIQWDT